MLAASAQRKRVTYQKSISSQNFRNKFFNSQTSQRFTSHHWQTERDVMVFALPKCTWTWNMIICPTQNQNQNANNSAEKSKSIHRLMYYYLLESICAGSKVEKFFWAEADYYRPTVFNEKRHHTETKQTTRDSTLLMCLNIEQKEKKNELLPANNFHNHSFVH